MFSIWQLISQQLQSKYDIQLNLLKVRQMVGRNLLHTVGQWPGSQEQLRYLNNYNPLCFIYYISRSIYCFQQLLSLEYQNSYGLVDHGQYPVESQEALVNPISGKPMVAVWSYLVLVNLKLPNKPYEAQVVNLREPYKPIEIIVSPGMSIGLSDCLSVYLTICMSPQNLAFCIFGKCRLRIIRRLCFIRLKIPNT